MTDNDMNELYRQKYLKYKAKYLELREQSGGVNPEDKIKFQNCAVLLLRIERYNTDATLKLIYSGETTDIKDNYYMMEKKKLTGAKQFAEGAKQFAEGATSDDTNYLVCVHNNRLQCFINQYFGKQNDTKINGLDKRYNFGDKTCKITELINDPNFNYIDQGTGQYKLSTVNIYIVRHGAGTHNLTPDEEKKLKNRFKKFLKLDPSLKEDGKEQAQRAKKNIPDKFDKLFASRLKRTRETISNLGVKTPDNTIYVLPCAHELVYNPGKDKKCDAHQIGVYNIREGIHKVGISLGENLEKCSELKFRNKNTRCTTENNYTVNWELYDKFYKNKKHCRDTNFVEQILFSILELANIAKNRTIRI